MLCCHPFVTTYVWIPPWHYFIIFLNCKNHLYFLTFTLSRILCSFSCMVQSGVIFDQCKEFPSALLTVPSLWWQSFSALLVWKFFPLILMDIILSWQISLKFWNFEDVIPCLISSIISAQKATEFFSEGNVPFCPLLAWMFFFAFAFQQFVYMCLFILPLLRHNRQMKLYFISLILDTVFFIFIQLGV